MPLAAGTRLGPYEVLAPLGAGGMGEVYRARDERLKREVAIKVLPSSFSADADRLRRFEQEAQAAGALNHPNILAIYDIGTHEGSPYLVSELLEGETLRGRLTGGAIAPRKALGHALQIAHGLAAAHEKGIVHRDLKPENLFVTKDGRVKILDFGLAKLTQAESGSRAATDLPTAGTEPGVVLGTMGYMSPEQVRGKPADPRSDIFSFGAVLYEMLSGNRAFRGDTAADTMSAILLKEPPELSASNRAVSPGLDRVVRHCLEKDPERRFHSAHDLAFDLEALSDISAPSEQGVRPISAWRVRPAWFIAGVAVLIAVVAAVALLRRPHATTIDSLAVLPFANASADPNAEYLSDGITESVINSLSQLPRLRVTGRTIVSHYKGREAEPQKVGRELNVSAVLTGKVLQRGDTLVIQADLTDVANGSQLWGDRYSRKMADILAVEEEIAKEISEKLRLKLTGEEKKRLAKRYTENTEAYQLYLKGRHEWEKRNEEPIRKSIEYFNQAIEKDPGYALAYAGLADAYASSPGYSVLLPRDAIPKSKAAAEKALALDDSLAGPHATLGLCLWSYDWNWTAGEIELKKAISLDGRYAVAHYWYAQLLNALGRSDEGIKEMQRARELDPFSGVIQQGLLAAYLFARQYDRALEEGRKAEAFAGAHAVIAQAYAAKGLPDQAASEYQKAADMLPARSGDRLQYSGIAQALAGHEAEARKAIEEMKALGSERYVSPFYIAAVFNRLGRKEETLEWLEKAYADHSFFLVYLKVNPSWDPVRSDPRFADLLRRLHLAGDGKN